METIQNRFQQMESQRTNEIKLLRDQLENKKKDLSRIEKSLFEERRSNKLLMSETQSMSRRSTNRISSSAEINAQEYIQNFLKLEEENRSLKEENKLLTEELVFVKDKSQEEQGLIFTSILGFVVNQRALG